VSDLLYVLRKIALRFNKRINYLT